MDDMDDCAPGDVGCRETLREIERFLDGELDAGVTAGIQRHLSGCNPCTQRAEFRRHLKVMISSKCSEGSVPPELLEKIHEMLSRGNLSPPLL
jgi:mycothiol system anti-sigma-R factor